MSHASLDASLDAPALHHLAREWDALRDAPHCDDTGYVRTVRALAERVVAHRARLFQRNAALLADAPDDDPTTLAQTESNQLAIKRCTTMLAEMAGVLGWTALPSS
jgi:thioesterase domain-containing protein